MESEQEAVLTSLGEELDAACRSLARNGEDKLQVFPAYYILFVFWMVSNTVSLLLYIHSTFDKHGSFSK